VVAQQQAGSGSSSSSAPQPLLRWDDTWPETLALDVSCAPALLASPDLQGPGQSLQQASQMAAEGKLPAQQPLVCHVSISDLHICTVKAHQACGRPVSRSSLGFDLFDDDVAPEGQAQKEGAAAAAVDVSASCPAQLCCCAAVLLCCCAAVLLCCCAAVLLCCCAAVLLRCCAAVLLCCCAAELLCCRSQLG
jgi:hypothetical protein